MICSNLTFYPLISFERVFYKTHYDLNSMHMLPPATSRGPVGVAARCVGGCEVVCGGDGRVGCLASALVSGEGLCESCHCECGSWGAFSVGGGERHVGCGGEVRQFRQDCESVSGERSGWIAFCGENIFCKAASVGLSGYAEQKEMTISFSK